MATEATRQVLASSVDVPGLSVISSSRHPDSARSGTIYDLSKLAAAVPVWFHPLNNGEYLVLFSRRLIDATPAAPVSPWPLLYTSFTESTAPVWAIVNPATGSVRNIEEIPSRKTGGRMLTAGASRGEYLFVLNTYDPPIDGDENTALLQHFRVDPLRGITLMTEEIVPGGLSLGLYADKSHLLVFGDVGTGLLTAARKNWGMIGINTDINPSWSWQYHGTTGWVSGGFSQAKPLGGNVPAHGPCSLARYRDTYYLMASTQTDYPNTYKQTTAVGTDPQGVAVSPDGLRVYVANRASKSVTVIDALTDLVIATVSVGDGPTAVAATNTFAYVLNAAEGTVMVIDATTLKVTTTIDVGDNPTSITANPDGTELWVTVQSNNSIQIIDIDADSATKNTVVDDITVSLAPQRVAFSSDGVDAYVTNFGTNTLWGIKTATRTTFRTIATGTGPLGVCVTPDGDWVFVANSTAKSITMIPTLSYKPLPEIEVGNVPIEVAATNTTAYVVNQSNNTVSVISVEFRDEVSVIDVGGNPHGIVLRPDGNRAYVSNRSGATISVISTVTNSVLPVPEGFNEPLPADVDARQQMNPFIQQLNGVLYGVINGFIQLGSGVTYMVTDLLDSAVSVITGTPLSDEGKGPVRVLVDDFLNALTGVGEVISDPAAIFEQIIGALTGVPVVGSLVTLAQNFLQGTINTILNVTTVIIGQAPIALLEQIIRAVIDLVTPPDPDPGQTSPTTVSTQVAEIKLWPESSWKARTYSNKKVQDDWFLRDFEYDLAPTDRTFLSGASLQDQLPLKSSFGSSTTSSGMTLLTEASEQTQVFTGSSPHLVVLPATAKVVGTTIGPDGVITVPDTTGGTIKPMIRIEDATVTEGVFGPKQVKFRVSLSAVAADTVTVRYTTSNQTATAGIDYVAATDTVSFVPGVISQEFALTVYGDLSYEPDETFLITLSNPVNSVLPDDPTALCTIVNDDRRTLVESLMEDLKNIINGVISGAIQVGSSIVNAVATILEQSVKTIVGTVTGTGELVLSMVDSFLNLISGGLVDVPGDFGTPAENFADIIAVLTNGSQGIGSAATTFANSFLAGVTTTVTAAASGVVSIFQNIVSSVIGFSPFGATPALMSAEGTPALLSTTDSTPVFYTPYVIHNQSTADIKVMASSRDKEVIVKHGSGMIFTPYTATPTSIKDWSYSYALERAPRIVQGFPFLSTRRLVVNTYHLVVHDNPTGGTFRLTHNGVVTASITYNPASSSATAENIRTALDTLESITSYEVVVVSATEFTITVTNDTGELNVFSYRLTHPPLTIADPNDGPRVQMTLDTTNQSTYLTRWAMLEPNPAPAMPSGVTKTPVALPLATTATGLELPEVLQQFVSVVGTVVNGGLAVSTSVVTTVTEIIDNAVLLITGDTSSTDASITALVTEFMQNLAVGGGATQDAATSFENIIRQITGGTGLPQTDAAATPLDFVTAVVDTAGNAGQDIFATLAGLLQTLVNAITGR